MKRGQIKTIPFSSAQIRVNPRLENQTRELNLKPFPVTTANGKYFPTSPLHRTSAYGALAGEREMIAGIT
jgi:hypothetical protein